MNKPLHKQKTKNRECNSADDMAEIGCLQKQFKLPVAESGIRCVEDDAVFQDDLPEVVKNHGDDGDDL